MEKIIVRCQVDCLVGEEVDVQLQEGAFQAAASMKHILCRKKSRQ